MVDLELATCLVVSGIGTLVFLKIVCDEVIVKHRALELRVEAEVEQAAQLARTKGKQQEEEAVEVGKAEDATTVDAA